MRLLLSADVCRRRHVRQPGVDGSDEHVRLPPQRAVFLLLDVFHALGEPSFGLDRAASAGRLGHEDADRVAVRRDPVAEPSRSRLDRVEVEEPRPHRVLVWPLPGPGGRLWRPHLVPAVAHDVDELEVLQDLEHHHARDGDVRQGEALLAGQQRERLALERFLPLPVHFLGDRHPRLQTQRLWATPSRYKHQRSWSGFRPRLEKCPVVIESRWIAESCIRYILSCSWSRLRWPPYVAVASLYFGDVVVETARLARTRVSLLMLLLSSSRYTRRARRRSL